MRYVIDTNVLVHIVRNSKTWQWIKLTFSPFDEEIKHLCHLLAWQKYLLLPKKTVGEILKSKH